MSTSPKTLYEVLGITPAATADQIKAAYRKAARATHPDAGGSSETFHIVAQAYEVLSDPAHKAAYDLRLGRGTRPGAGSAAGTAGPSQARTAYPQSAGPARDALADAPRFVPDFSPGSPPVLPLALAGQQVHGSPRRPGFFSRLGSGAAARYDGEVLTIGLLQRTLLADYPAGRLVNGLHMPDRSPRGGNLDVGHVLLGGYRMAVLESQLAAPGNYNWDGRHLRNRGREVNTGRLADSVRTLQDRFPECNVTGWVLLHSPNGNPFEPVVDYPPSLSRRSPAMVHVGNAGTLQRELRRFFNDGPQPNVVQLPVLGGLIDASTR
ncbi:J domain-containing protein [Arthrobacter jiangjiafuii]|uniref:J domain-containing protein n=1 Tax=Arthrobacter jiangjiafuii TaxID=2817475 RepID=A0A975M3J7_9MICC|nr:DnaJ domain-containing protein [Arthrobacter jiangjiafuii]MBP3044582.1 DnaJ domain-containing protein [Arthrobacter jiangjiafuii]QWC09316.1 J domain-containing protein [Arthrobacter jiangjiafuii]